MSPYRWVGLAFGAALLAAAGWALSQLRRGGPAPIRLEPRHPAPAEPPPAAGREVRPPAEEAAAKEAPARLRVVGGRPAGRPAVTTLTRNLKGMSFPAGKRELVGYVRERGADETVVAAIERLPERTYRSMRDVMRGYGEEQAPAQV